MQKNSTVAAAESTIVLMIAIFKQWQSSQILQMQKIQKLFCITTKKHAKTHVRAAEQKTGENQRKNQKIRHVTRASSYRQLKRNSIYYKDLHICIELYANAHNSIDLYTIAHNSTDLQTVAHNRSQANTSEYRKTQAGCKILYIAFCRRLHYVYVFVYEYVFVFEFEYEYVHVLVHVHDYVFVYDYSSNNKEYAPSA